MGAFPDIRMDGVYYGYANMEAPWSICVPASDNAILYVMHEGECWFQSTVGSTEPLLVRAGAIVGCPAGQQHYWRDSLSTPKARTEGIFALSPKPNRETDASGKATKFFIGSVKRSANPLIDVLPPVIYIPPTASDTVAALSRTLELIETIMNSAYANSEADPIVRRLSEVVVIEVTRYCLKRIPQDDLGWLGGLTDRFIMRALALIHEHPERDWTIELLAGQVGLSRSAFAERFRRLVGDSPVHYLMKIRMHKAEAEIRAGKASFAEIAVKTGYQSEASLCRAFKRSLGVTPGQYRMQVKTNAPKAGAEL